MSPVRYIKKTLSANDTGETGANQAGILVPKVPEVLSFFPKLDGSEKNPRLTMFFYEEDGSTKWPFEFIYYNNKYFGGTRNEYRLTCMTQYLRAKYAQQGDEIEFRLDDNGRRSISIRRRKDLFTEEEGILKLSGGWKVVRVR
jgi:hypothetical protein